MIKATCYVRRTVVTHHFADHWLAYRRAQRDALKYPEDRDCRAEYRRTASVIRAIIDYLRRVERRALLENKL